MRGFFLFKFANISAIRGKELPTALELGPNPPLQLTKTAEIRLL
jgi:hypothetical protein